MFSATWPKDVRKLAADFHKNPVHLNVGSLDLAANHNILQTIECLEDNQKNSKLFEILDAIFLEDVSFRFKLIIFLNIGQDKDFNFCRNQTKS
jgi:ATP-dependent RNA helicase DDX5/DBP2